MTRNGFTLVEVLVALAVFALLSVGAVSMLSFTISSQEAVESRLTRLADIERTRAILIADLTQAAERPTRDDEGLRWPFRISPAASGAVMSFARRGWENPEGRARASLIYVEYALTDGVLERRVRPMLDGAPLSAPQPLLTNVKSVTFAEPAFGAWSEMSANVRGTPPVALRVTFEIEGLGTVSQAALIGSPP